MSYASRVDFSTKVAVDSEPLSERGEGVALGVADGLGKGGGLAFCCGVTTACGELAVLAFSFSAASVATLGKRGVFGCLGRETAAPVMSLPFTRRSRLPALATWTHVSERALSAFTEVEKIACGAAFSAVIHFPESGSRSKMGFVFTHVVWAGRSTLVR